MLENILSDMPLKPYEMHPKKVQLLRVLLCRESIIFSFVDMLFAK